MRAYPVIRKQDITTRPKNITPEQRALREPKLTRVVDDSVDHHDSEKHEVAQPKIITPEQLALQEYSVKRLFDISIAHHNNGGHGALWPEGTRNDEDPTKIMKLQKGIGLILASIDPGINMRVLNVSVDYGKPRKGLPRLRPTVFVSRPLEVKSRDPEAIARAVQAYMQFGLDRVLELR
jgi:hypothetical protein